MSSSDRLRFARHDAIFAIKRLMWAREDEEWQAEAEARRARIEALHKRFREAEARSAALRADIAARREREKALLANL